MRNNIVNPDQDVIANVQPIDEAAEGNALLVKVAGSDGSPITVVGPINEETGDRAVIVSMTGAPTEGGVEKLNVTDENAVQLLGGVLKELKVMNLHLALITDVFIGKEETD
jgi:hypothetical protein